MAALRLTAALALLAVATSTANLPLAIACVAGGLGIAATLPPDRV